MRTENPGSHDGLILRSGRVLTPLGWLAGADILVREGRLVAIGHDLAAQAGDAPHVDLSGHIVAPGFVDLHVHGALGHDVMDATMGGLGRLLAYHAAGGTTALLATTATSARHDLVAALECLRQAQREQADGPATGAQLLGAHVEGPYLSPTKPGCHLRQYLRDPNPWDDAVLFEFADVVRHVTLAPERAGALDLIERLASAGITPSMGHTEATEPVIRAALQRGLRHATHLYNAMSRATKVGLSRVPGAVEVALAEDGMTTEVIADGHHVAPTLIRLAVKAKGAAGLCVVTDAMRAAGMPAGEYTFGPRDGTPVRVQDGIACTLDGASLASSVTPMDTMVRFLVQEVGLPLEVAVTMAATTPARVAGVDARKGTIMVGKDADLVVLDEDLYVAMTLVGGQVVYQRTGQASALRTQ